MSLIDPYKPCVCGSGKKFKFCKCGATDNAPELEKVIRLIDGEQELAAMDRINSLLAKLPNAAWLLAIKAELQLTMQEYQPLAETAQRFLKLKPDNPLALILCSIADGVQQQPIEMQARHLMAGLSESRDAVPRPTGYAIQLLTQRMIHSNYESLIGVWGELQEPLSQHSPDLSVLRDPSIHLACKTANKVIESPPGAPWRERLNEVGGLVSTFRYEQAEKKLHAILRDFPNQPEPLSLLLRAQVAQLDRAGAIATATKLASLPDLKAEDRAYFRLLAWEYERTPLEPQDWIRYGEIESDEKLIEVLRGLECAEAEDSEELRFLVSSITADEVPAKLVFQLYHSQPFQGRTLKTLSGMVAVFGKQTDKPARALLVATDFPPYRPVLEQVAGLLALTHPLPAPAFQRQSYVQFLNREAHFTDENRGWLSLADRGRLLIEDFLSLPQQVLAGQTPREAANDPSQRDNLLALLLHLEGAQSIVVPAGTIPELYQRLGIPAPAHTATPQPGQPATIATLMDALRFDLSQCGSSLLPHLMHLAIKHGALRMQLELARLIIDQENQSDLFSSRFVAYSILFELDSDIEAKLEYSQQLQEMHAAAQKPVGRQVLGHMGLLMHLGRSAEARAHLEAALRKYPGDPELAAFMQQLQYQLDRPAVGGGLAQRMVPGATAMDTDEYASSGLVLPGQSAPSSPQESKLWLPES